MTQRRDRRVRAGAEGRRSAGGTDMFQAGGKRMTERAKGVMKPGVPRR